MNEMEARVTPWPREGLAMALMGAAVLGYYLSPNLLLAPLASLAFLFLVWRRLDLGLLVVLLTMPFYRFPKILELGPLGQLAGRERSLEVSLAEYALLICVIAWLARRAYPPPESSPAERLSTPLKERWVWLPAVLLIGVAALSLSFTEYRQVALREFRVVIVEPAVYYLLLVDTLRREESVGRFLWALTALGFGIGLYSIYHYIFVGVVESTGSVDRVLAVYHSPNALALFLGRVIPIAGALTLGLLTTRRTSEHPRFPRALAIFGGVSLALMAVTFYLTYSRGAVLGVAAAALVLLFGRSRRSALLILGVLALTGLAAALLIPQERLLAATPLLQRLYVWQAALAIAVDHPLTGVGLDNFLYYYPRYILPHAVMEPDISHAHNIFLDFWTRLSILGLLVLALLQGVFWRRVQNLLRKPVASYYRWFVLGLAASMVDFLVHGLIDNSYFLIDLAFMFWLTYALVTILDRSSSPSSLAGFAQ